MKNVMVKLIGKYLNTLALIAPKYAAKKGFTIFCTPFAPPLKQYQFDFYNTAEQFNFQFEGKKVQCFKWGNGKKKIMLVHGWASHSFRWKRLIEDLKKENCTIYAMDAPAHGMSSGKILHVLKYHHCLVEMIKQTGNMDVFVGHSIGGFMLLYTMYKLPELQTAKMVIMGAPGESIDFLNFYKSTLKLSDKTMKLITDYFINEIKQQPAYFSSKRFAPFVNCDTLLIHDEKDVDTNVAYTKTLGEVMPNNELVITEGLGHKLHADWLNKKIIDFSMQK
jgi:pimeloyl-ACP methyl ester carboxylesterase